MEHKKNIVITGSSSGIGEACVNLLLQNNYRVFACVRQNKDLTKFDDSKTSGTVIPIFMDLNEAKSIDSAFEKISNECSDAGLYGLINNAAIAKLEAVEYMSMDSLKEQFEINLFAQIKLIQKFIPLLKTGKGRIINMSSNNGYISMPFMGAYCATKFAFEAISDALRIELAPWNIPVIVINPDKIKSPIWRKTIAASNEDFKKLDDNIKQCYQKSYENFISSVTKIEQKSLPPTIVAKTVLKTLQNTRTKTRYLPDFESKLVYLVYRIVSKRTLNKLIAREVKL